DAANDVGSSTSETVTVKNADVVAPTATIVSPSSGSSLAGLVSVNVSASDNVGVTKVEWYRNGVLAGSSSTASPSFSWDTTTSANGSYALQAKAYDAAGHVSTSTPVDVSVQNVPPDVTAPTVVITAPS